MPHHDDEEELKLLIAARRLEMIHEHQELKRRMWRLIPISVVIGVLAFWEFKTNALGLWLANWIAR